MTRHNAALLAALACFGGAISGTIAAAQADTGSTGSTGSTASTGTTGTTGATGATATPATITINGAGYATIDSSAPTATFQSDYLAALGAAVTDAQTKASTLATQVGDTLGLVQSITEESNDDSACSGPLMFAATPGAARGAPSAAPSHKSHKHHKATARIADDSSQTCTIEADVTITYAMS